MSGGKPDGSLAHEQLIEHCQELWADGQTLLTSSKSALWRFRNDLPEGHRLENGADRPFVTD